MVIQEPIRRGDIKLPRYCYLCPNCDDEIEVVRPMNLSDVSVVCPCGAKMNRDFPAERVLVGAGKRSYHKPIISDSLAMNLNQIPEHRRLFPDVQVTSEGQPVFDNFESHEKYLKTCNIVKEPQRKKKRGKRIA